MLNADPPLRPKILVVDDTPANLVAMRRLLAQSGAQLVEAASGNEALAHCLDQRFALILLDVNMPGMDGYEVAALLADEPNNHDTPIIFVTASYADDFNLLKGYHSGAVDYIAKPINDAILLSKVKVFLELETSRIRLTQALASLEERNRQLESEVAERRRIEEQMRHLATHDDLTGLPNRALFFDAMARFFARAERHGERFALLYMDLDGFKLVNDRTGHRAGDALLQAFAQRLRANVRREDMAARLGGDEFGVLLSGAANPDEVKSVCGKLGAALSAPYRLAVDGEPLTAEVGASVGAAIALVHGATPEALLQAADEAMYAVKRERRGRPAPDRA